MFKCFAHCSDTAKTSLQRKKVDITLGALRSSAATKGCHPSAHIHPVVLPSVANRVAAG